MTDITGRRISSRFKLNTVLGAAVGLIVLLVLTGMVAMWPQQLGSATANDSETAESGSAQPTQVTYVTGTVTNLSEAACLGASAGTDAGAEAGAAAKCTVLTVKLPIGERVTVSLDELRSDTVRVSEGDQVKLAVSEFVSDGEPVTQYSYSDQPRGGKMIFIALLFIAAVLLVGRLRGGLALIGVGAAVLLLALFLLPSILDGNPPVLVAIVGSLGIMVVVLYLAHGISHRTTAALFGSVFGIVFTAVAGYLVTRWLGFSGIAGEEDAGLLLAVPGLNMSDVLTATMVIAGLGVLNDITVAQASGVWEMRALNPALSKRRIYQSAMRMGRDHIASSIYTLVFSYAGAMFVVLLLLFTAPQDLGSLVTSERISQEIIRTLIGAAGLVLSMPVTTLLAVQFAPAPEGPSDNAAEVQLPAHGHSH